MKADIFSYSKAPTLENGKSMQKTETETLQQQFLVNLLPFTPLAALICSLLPSVLCLQKVTD